MNQDLTLSCFKDKGYKITNARRSIIDIFSIADKPLSARELHKELEKLGIFVNKTTVYREIVFLLKIGYLSEINLKPIEISYEPKDLIHHHHLVCESCGKVDNITNCLVKELDGNVLKKKGFKITRHSLEFYGTCAVCSKKHKYGK